MTTSRATAPTRRQQGPAGAGTPSSYFDAVYAHGDDPWHYRDRWFEARKRALLMAMLDRPRFASAFEPGCANGELTAALVPRCGHLIAADRHARAVEAARRRIGKVPHAEVRQMAVPAQWPEGRFDLVVVSEFAYYLNEDEVGALGRRIRASMRRDGLLLACHWLHPFAERACDSETVHRVLGRESGLRACCSYREPDFLVQTWTADGLCASQREAGQ
ncbi:SAM-dependent methyltransferase [Cupriavidus sp. AU9028]|uniref:SAM-dependent methyltransferase n=1 Tax=Cupriavidus sp. AU9028 TaxID=2871157 RepID=UPI001C95508A|nr:SAM-dependent methyltransferase [Cupriavidus sp. AU9028]MBY4897930.1 nodulation S family protein [Cupriavidus sp. AU9028]